MTARDGHAVLGPPSTANRDEPDPCTVRSQVELSFDSLDTNLHSQTIQKLAIGSR
jgi:hypothetical protein